MTCWSDTNRNRHLKNIYSPKKYYKSSILPSTNIPIKRSIICN